MLDVVHLHPSRSPGRMMDCLISKSSGFPQPKLSPSTSMSFINTNLLSTSPYSSYSLRRRNPHLLKCFCTAKFTPSSFLHHHQQQRKPPQINPPIQTVHRQNPIKIIFNLLNTLQKPLAAAILVGLLLMYSPNQALAASGGRVGGRSFSSYSSSKSYSYSAPSAPSMSGGPGFSYSVPYYGPSPFGGGYIAPAAGLGSGFFLIITAVAAFVLVSGFLSDGDGSSSVLADTQKTSVLKLQVGLLGLGRSLQKDLNRIANTADTSTSEGLHYVLTETMLALLRHPDYCISGYSSVDVKNSVDDGEKRFNKLSIEERGKFDEETLVNMNNIKKQSATGLRTSGFSNEYIVVTVLVAAVGVHKLPSINNSKDLKEAAQKLASIPSSRTLAVEVLWTPQDEGDTLSERELLEDYPLLRPL